MGVMTLSEFRSDVASGLQRGTPDAIGKPLVDRWIFNAMVEFGYAFKFRQLEGLNEQTLLTDTSAVVFPLDFRMMHENGIELVGTSRFEGALVPETRAQYIRALRTVAGDVRPGRPYYYHIFADEFRVRPVADADYTLVVHYWKRLQPLVDDDDVSIFEADWDDAILLGAKYRGFRHFNEFDRYQNVRNDFLGVVRSRLLEEDLEEFPEGGVQPVTWKDMEAATFFGIPSDPHDREYGEGPSR